MRRLHHLTFTLIPLVQLLFLAGSAVALPAVQRARTESVVRRADGDTVVVNTTQISNSSEGPMSSECRLQLTPVTLENGEPATQVVKNCTVALITGGPPAGSPGGNGGVIGGTNPPPPPAVAYTTTSLTTSTSTANEQPTPDVPTPTLAGALTPSDSSSPVAVAGVAETSPYTIGGKKLSVLPIGLGVFAGISIIALIVVALVTWERTKYRKAFRQRKLAEVKAFGQTY